ncbi:MAG: hypothetical protein V4673_06530 [Pseudomonadota bacterium]
MIKGCALAFHTVAAVLSPVLRGIDSMERPTKYRVHLKGLTAISLSAFLLAAVGACASQSSSNAEFNTKDVVVGQAVADSGGASTTDGQARPAQDSPDTAITLPPDQATVSCPSQNFADFLKIYADLDDDRVRRTFTAMPLEYSVPTYTLRDDSKNLPPFTVTKLTSTDRSRYFGYRYIPKLGDYRNIGTEGQFLQNVLKLNPDEYKFPIKVSKRGNGDREVVMGMEYAIDVFLFARRKGCWYLARVTNPSD